MSTGKKRRLRKLEKSTLKGRIIAVEDNEWNHWLVEVQGLIPADDEIPETDRPEDAPPRRRLSKNDRVVFLSALEMAL